MVRGTPLAGWFLLIAAAGAGLFVWGSILPAYTDPDAASHLFMQACDDDMQVVSSWYGRMDQLRTARYPLMDGGAGLALAGLTAMLFCLVLRVSRLQDLAAARSPSRRWQFMALGLLALGWAWLANMAALSLGLERELYPWCADSIAIPMAGLTMLLVLIASVSAACGLFAMRFFGPLPARLGVWDLQRTTLSWVLTIIAALLVAAMAIYAGSAALTEYFAVVPACILAIYLLVSTRAALLSRNG